ncbi:unnamed protein product [Prunus armeniaca]|uniref:NB-ARC domain-containing protein n=1 Tax=Prunus armeniaca TaxID=36596 RepID=A0A6J5UNI3_PRUAR|nr:unnamed protein product [Prunus armeniaca]
MESPIQAMIETLTEQVFKALVNQAQFSIEFSGQFKQMKTGLDLAKALLADTENLNRKNETVRAGLTHLKEVIYKADDVLTDCLVRHEYMKDASWAVYLLLDPFFCHRMGKKLRGINQHMKEIEKTLGRFLKAPDSIHADDSYQVRGIMSQDWNPTDTIGLDDDVEKIKGWMFDTTTPLHRIGIVGMGGLGKTTISQKIFHDVKVLAHFDKMIWVCVSQSFSAERIMRSILEREDLKGRDASLLWMMCGVTQRWTGGLTCVLFYQKKTAAS